MAHQLANRFREVILNGTWIANTNWEKELSNTNFLTATSKISDLNRIADLTYHILYYIKGINSFFKTGKLDIKDSESFQTSPLSNESDWENLKNELFNQAELFAENIENLSNEQLESTFYDPKYGTYKRNIEGQIEHAYYHLGQVVLLRKLIV